LNTLTKLFVVLLVITSILTAAAAVVFVSRVQPMQTLLEAQKATADTLRAQASAANAALEKERALVSEGQMALENARKSDADQMRTLQSQVESDQTTIAQLQAEKAGRDSTVNTLTSGVSEATATMNKLMEQVTNLRASNDTLVKRNEDYSRRNSELNAEMEALHSREADAEEQLATAKENVQKLAAWTKDHGGNPDALLTEANPGGPGAPAISGVVREKSVINGKLWVTINVGSADGVAKGMKFYVLNGGQFLGIVTVDTVDSNDAIGMLEGDAAKLEQVHPGNDVRTQIRG
jgi:predicted  nucleic acid-binding Zn-ribbon protein